MKAEALKPSPMPKEIGIWIRVSTEDQAKGESPEHHEKRARYYAESKGWQIKEVYHLEAVSGKSVKDHSECQRMQKDIKSGHITGLIFSKLARLARNTRELLDFADYFREYSADLISLQESIDTSSPAGRLFYTMIAAMAEWERDEIASRVAASVPIRAKLGKPLGGAAPFGYRWIKETKQLVPDQEESPIRKLMYDKFLECRKIRTVARLLNEAGYRTRKGSKFSGTTVERLIRDSTAKGSRKANYTKAISHTGAWAIKPESEWVWTDVEPIVSDEVWEQCNWFLEKNHNGKRPARHTVQLFAGIAHCSCGNKMYVPVKSPKYICSKCKNKIGIADLEAVFHEQLKTYFFSPTEIGAYLQGMDRNLKEKEASLKSLEQERQKIQVQMDLVYRLHVDGKISANEFAERYGPLEERKKQVQNQIPNLQGEIDFIRVTNLSSDQILNEARDLYSRWESLEITDKRKIVENITEKITIGADEVEIDLCYLPSSLENVSRMPRNLRGSWRPPT
jgi:site-specific DNA recombinase